MVPRPKDQRQQCPKNIYNHPGPTLISRIFRVFNVHVVHSYKSLLEIILLKVCTSEVCSSQFFGWDRKNPWLTSGNSFFRGLLFVGGKSLYSSLTDTKISPLCIALFCKVLISWCREVRSVYTPHSLLVISKHVESRGWALLRKCLDDLTQKTILKCFIFLASSER